MRLSPQRERLVPHPIKAHGFTLVELVIVVGIIALLSALALVGVNAARKGAQRTRIQSDLALIGQALEVYKDNFHDYPRFADPVADQQDYKLNTPGNGTWLDYTQTGMVGSDRGARLLCQALISPGPESSSDPSNLGGQDGAGGSGFRTVRKYSASGTLVGKVWGPYLAADKFKLEHNPTVPNMQDAKILDILGNPILYYPAMPASPAVTVQYSYVCKVDPANYTPPTVGQTPSSVSSAKPLYNAFDNTFDTTTGKYLVSEAQMQYVMGIKNVNRMDGCISTVENPPEAATTTKSYLLWTAGSDGKFCFGNDPATNLPKAPGTGSDAFPGQKTDDITDFDLPAGVKK